MSASVRNFRGEIAYLRDGTVAAGREYFSTSVFPDGTRTMRAECHFFDDDLVRDVVCTLDASWRPIDAYLRVAKARRFLGSGWYRFTSERTSCYSIDAERRPRETVRDSSAPVPACGFHPLSNDGSWPAMFDLSRPDEIQCFPGCVTYSKDPIGDGELAIETFDLEITYRGPRRVTVAAGTFDCRHFAVLIRGFQTPFEISAWGDDFINVRETWAEMPGQSFELAAFQPAPR
jgi:hypothetical protein